MTSRFQIEDLVEQDERGVTYMAQDNETGLKVALRRFFREKAESMRNAEWENFRKELKNAISLKHPNLRRVLGGGIDDIDKVGYIATQWIEGDSISGSLKGRYLDASEAVTVLRQALELMIFLEDKTPLRISVSPRSIIKNAKKEDHYTFWFSLSRFSYRRKGRRKKEFFDELVEFLNSVLRRSTIVGASHYCRLRGWMDLVSASDFTYEEALRALPEPEDTLVPLPGMSGQDVTPAVDALHLLHSEDGSQLSLPSRPEAKVKKVRKQHKLWLKEKKYKQEKLATMIACGSALAMMVFVLYTVVTSS